MKLQIASAVALAVLSTAALTTGAGASESLTSNHVQSAYAVDPATQCSKAAGQDGNLSRGLTACDQALAEPMTRNRAGLLVDRGILKFKSGEAQAALIDFNQAVDANPKLGNAYLNRAVALIALHRSGDARQDVDQAIELGAEGNMHVAYYSRAEIEDDAGDYKAAYNDYRQALAIKPDYAAASHELERFHVNSRTATR